MSLAARRRVVYRHSIVTRLTHWFVTLSVVVLVMSGLKIFNATPYLDASGASNSGHRVLAVAAHRDAATGQPVGTTALFGHTFTTTGPTAGTPRLSRTLSHFACASKASLSDRRSSRSRRYAAWRTSTRSRATIASRAEASSAAGGEFGSRRYSGPSA